MLDRVQLEEDDLKENFNYWLKKKSYDKKPNDELFQILQKIPSTHTFGYEKFIEGEITYPHKEIFFNEKFDGLLSDGYRLEKNLFKEHEPRPTAKEARKQKLTNYVFTYLGIHQPYYAYPNRNFSHKVNYVEPKPFGVFIDHSEESFPDCNSTRRDLASPEAGKGTKTRKEYLLPTDGRKIAAYQIENEEEFESDFWNYYGTIDNWEERCEILWQKFIEMHFFKKVDLSKIKAILWPYWLEAVDEVEIYDDTLHEIYSLKEKMPDCKFIRYEIKLGEGKSAELSFISASYLVSKYFIENDEFPDSLDEIENEE